MASQSAGIGSALPDQLGYSGYVLTTDGTVASWEAVGVLPGVTTMAAVGIVPNANGASIASATLTLQPADGTHPGVVTELAQTIGGAKTFSGAITASNLSGTNSGDITLSAFGSTPDAKGAILTAQALALQPADATHPGLVTTGTQTFGGAKTFSSISLGTLTTIIDNSGVNTVLTYDAGGFYFRQGAVYQALWGNAVLDFSGGGVANSKIQFSYTDTSGTPGAGAGNTPTGRSAVVSGSGAAFDISNTKVNSTSIIMVTYLDADATAWPLKIVPGTNKFTVTPAAAATGNSKFMWVVFN